MSASVLSNALSEAVATARAEVARSAAVTRPPDPRDALVGDAMATMRSLLLDSATKNGVA